MTEEEAIQLVRNLYPEETKQYSIDWWPLEQKVLLGLLCNKMMRLPYLIDQLAYKHLFEREIDILRRSVADTAQDTWNRVNSMHTRYYTEMTAYFDKIVKLNKLKTEEEE